MLLQPMVVVGASSGFCFGGDFNFVKHSTYVFYYTKNKLNTLRKSI